jgi:hypothetical protein
MSNIQLPSGFVEVAHKNPFYLVYLDGSVSRLCTESGELLVHSHGVCELIVITYGKQRRAIAQSKSENHIEWCSDIGQNGASNLLSAAINHLLQMGNLEDGHDAFIFTPRAFNQGGIQEFGKGLVCPLCHPGPGKFWYLLGVIEKV